MNRPTWLYLVLALPMMGIGAAMLLASFGVFGHPASHPGDAPDWIGIVIGFIFLAGPAAAIVNASGALASPLLRAVGALLGYFVVAGLALLFSWTAFGPGARNFSGSGAFLGPFVGRAAFGVAGVLTWLALGWGAIRWFNRGR
jgi:hypothetical protein